MKVKDKRQHRKIRIRKKINGTATVPRLAVFKSNNNIYVQAIDDLNQVTIASASTLSKEVKTKTLSTEASKEVGELMGQKLSKLKHAAQRASRARSRDVAVCCCYMCVHKSKN